MNDKLQANTLHTLSEGLTGRVIDHAIDEVMTDCERRPFLGTKRKITITLEFTPIDLEGVLRSVDIETKIDVKVPSQQLPPVLLPVTDELTAEGKPRTRAKLPDTYQVTMFTESPDATHTPEEAN